MTEYEGIVKIIEMGIDYVPVAQKGNKIGNLKAVPVCIVKMSVQIPQGEIGEFMKHMDEQNKVKVEIR